MASKQLIELMKQEVDSVRESRLPMVKAFESIAKKTGLKPNTVRNYYYRYIYDKQDKNISIPAGRSFTPQEVDDLMISMLVAQGHGQSVRGCANQLSGGDPKLLIRLQNKYRNVIASKREYVNELMAKMQAEGMTFYNPYTKQYINGNSSLEQWDSDDILDSISRFVSNIQKINNSSLYSLINGLKNLSQMALDGMDYGREQYQKRLSVLEQDIKERDKKIYEINNQILIYKTQLDEQRHKTNRLISMFRQLIAINRKFLDLSSTGKISELNEYISELGDYIESYKLAEEE